MLVGCQCVVGDKHLFLVFRPCEFYPPPPVSTSSVLGPAPPEED